MTLTTSAVQEPTEALERTGERPPISVVVATRHRPQLLRRALRSILGQTYSGRLEVIAVFDQTPVDDLDDLPALPEGRSLRLLSNERSPGLAGARNSGITAATGELVAFCDDDDEWEPTKLDRQVDLWATTPSAVAVGAGIRIEGEAGSHVRIPPREADHDMFLASRLTEIHPSGFLLRRSDLIGRVGLVDESLPASYGEDYDLLLRLTRHGKVVSAQEALVVVHWNRTSFFSDKWQGIADGLTYLLRKHPEFARSRRGTARIAGQVAFAHAALGARGDAARWAWAAVRRDPRQLRAWAALTVAVRLLPAARLVQLVNSRGRGL